MPLFCFSLMSHRTKFSPRAPFWFFVGYPPTAKGYKLYDILFLSHSLYLEMNFLMNLFFLIIPLLILMIFLILCSQLNPTYTIGESNYTSK